VNKQDINNVVIGEKFLVQTMEIGPSLSVRKFLSLKRSLATKKFIVSRGGGTLEIKKRIEI
jgi:hypothetical protein